MYKKLVLRLFDTEKTYIIHENGDNSFTSFSTDENSSHYQQFLVWVAEGNEAELLDA